MFSGQYKSSVQRQQTRLPTTAREARSRIAEQPQESSHSSPGEDHEVHEDPGQMGGPFDVPYNDFRIDLRTPANLNRILP